MDIRGLRHPASAPVPAGDPEWLLVAVPALTWALLELLRRIDGRPTRSDELDDLLRQGLSIDPTSEEGRAA